MNQQQETKTCKYCGTEIPKSAKVCPNCRKKQSHKVRNTILIILGVLIVIGVFGAMFGRGGGNTTTTETAESSVYTVGQTGEVNGVSVTLNSVQATDSIDVAGVPMTAPEGSVYLVTNWNVVNNSDSDVVVTQASFESYVDNQTVQPSGVSYMSDTSFTSDLTLASGRETSGDIIYEVPTSWQLFEESFKPNTLLDDSVEFQVTPDQVTQ